jgi:hypothetical protein
MKGLQIKTNESTSNSKQASGCSEQTTPSSQSVIRGFTEGKETLEKTSKEVCSFLKIDSNYIVTRCP